MRAIFITIKVALLIQIFNHQNNLNCKKQYLLNIHHSDLCWFFEFLRLV